MLGRKRPFRHRDLIRISLTGVGVVLDSVAKQSHHVRWVASCRVQSTRHPEPSIVTPLGVRSLFAGGWSWPWDRLRKLDLEACLIRDEGLAELTRGGAAALPLLTDLDVSGNEISDDGVRLLVASPLWPRLKRLVLGGLAFFCVRLSPHYVEP